MDELYLAPALTRIPEQVRMARDYVEVAREFMRGPSYEYISGGSAAGLTAALNLRAFESLTVCPRVMRDIGSAHTRVEIPGASLAHPVLLAPVAHQVLAHPGAERETARGAAVTGTCMVASTLSTCTVEQIAAAGDATPRWFQLYLQPDEAATTELVHRAVRAGYSAIVITVDAALQVPGQGAMRLGFRMPPGAVPGSLRNPSEGESASSGNGDGRILRAAAAATPTWQQLLAVSESTSLPVWIKGVMHPEDAVAVKERGFSGIVVSNHGGRSLDGAPASLDALPLIRDAVGDEYPLLFDGGIRSGLDVFHSLARGADAVLVGRLQMYALAVAGALGVAHVLRLLREELEVCMALTGCTSIRSIRAQCGVVRPC
jgi:isopentenyl diphosphate isomerase/L-lactate dehydrogenase-like FMN-dependent dehydrogenase